MEHFCQRIVSDNPNHLSLTIPDDPAACGKPAHFVFEESNFLDEWGDEQNTKFWLCAECYDFSKHNEF